MTRRAGRSAFTLLELMLVMAILVVAGALVYTSINSMYGYYKLNAGVDSVRAAWAQARARAIEQGRSFRFSIEPDGSFFRVAPDKEEYWGGGGAPASDPEGTPYILEDKLPGGVLFIINGDPKPTPPAAGVEQAKPSGKWDTVCVFNCDGTAREDVRIVFQVRGTAPMALQLRGLTGASAVSTLSFK